MSNADITFNGVAHASLYYKKPLLRAFARVLKRGIFLNGPEIVTLEKNLTNFLKVKQITTVSSGHDALLLALQALQMKKGDEIIIPVNSYPTAFPTAMTGLTIIPVDVDENGQLNPKKVEAAITKKTRAVVMVHLYGLVGNLKAMQLLAKKHHIHLIEDVAHAFGTTYRKKHVGTIGDIGCFSFYPTKNLGSLGDGGAIYSKKKDIHAYLTMAKSYGEKIRYQSQFISGHSRLPELQAAGLSVYLQGFLKQAKKRKLVAIWYKNAWKKAGLSSFGRILESSKDSVAVPHLLVAAVKKRTLLMKYLHTKKIPTAIHYPRPIHKTKAFTFKRSATHQYAIAEKLSQEIISLPFHGFMRRSDVTETVQHIKAFYETTTV